MATDLTVRTEDRPGQLARVGEALGAAGINIEGFCGIGVGGEGIMHVLVEDAATARAALESAGIGVEAEVEAIVADMSADTNTPGALGRAARAVADAGVNVVAAYIATNNRAVLVTDDNPKARTALGM